MTFMMLARKYQWGIGVEFEYLINGRIMKMNVIQGVWTLYIGFKTFTFESFEDLVEFVFEMETALKDRLSK